MKSYYIILYVWIIYLTIRNLRLIFKQQKRKRKYNFKNIKSINLGSSHSYFAFLGADEKINLNLAHISQPFYYDKIILNKFIDKIKKELVCFITISYFSFSSRKSWIEQEYISQYYVPLSIRNFKDKERINYVLYNYFPIIFRFKNNLKEKLNKTKKKKEMTIERRIKGHVKKLENIDYREYNLNLLEEIIKKCQDNSIKVVLLTTPFQKEYNDYFSEELLEKNFYNVIEGITEKYKIKYLDYSHDYINFDKKEYFQKNDYDHLSLDGAKILMRLLEKELKIKLI